MRDTNGAPLRNFSSGISSPVKILEPSDSAYISGSFSFSNHSIPPYTRVKIMSSLNLGHVQNPHSPSPIQKRVYEVQLAELYIWNPKARVLLVVNNRTNLNEVSFNLNEVSFQEK